MELKELIAKRQAESARRRHELELFDAETRGMIAAHDLSGDAQAATTLQDQDILKTVNGYRIVRHMAPSVVKRGGRQPGAISSEWRAILRALFLDKAHGFTEEHVVPVAATQGITIKPKDAKDRLEKYKQHDFIEMVDGLYKVTRHAATKFGFLHDYNRPTINLANIDWNETPPDWDDVIGGQE